MRIASLLPSSTEIVCALGLQDFLVGITHECDFPASIAHLLRLTASHISHEHMTSLQIDHTVRSQLDGHGSIYALDEELLQSLKPDLILTQELCDVCAVSYKTVQKAARMLDVGTKIVSLEPSTLQDIFDNIRTVAELTGTAAQADPLIHDLQLRLDCISDRLNSVSYRPRTMLIEWLEPPFGPGHWVPYQVSAAGGEGSFGRRGTPSVVITAEDMASYDPEVIVLVPCGYYKNEIINALSQAHLPTGWLDLRAVQDNQVWAVDATSYYSRPGPRVVDGVEILARILHPNIFGSPSFADAVRVARDQMHT